MRRPAGGVKIGTTTRVPKRRVSSARREYDDYTIEFVEAWPHARAYLVERFSHIYLQTYLEFGEWFDVTPKHAKRVILKTLAFIPPVGQRVMRYGGVDWIKTVGVSAAEMDAYFAGSRAAIGRNIAPYASLSERLIADYNAERDAASVRAKPFRDQVKAAHSQRQEDFYRWYGGKEKFYRDYNLHRAKEALS